MADVFLQGVFDDIDLVDGYLIATTYDHWSESINAVLISSIHKRLRAATSHATPKVILRDILYASCLIPPHPQPTIEGASLSICTFHWMTEAERKRKGITMTTLLRTRSEETSRYYSVMDSFRLEAAVDISSTSKSETLSPSDGVSRLRHVGHLDSTALTRQPNYNRYARQLSQVNSTVIDSNCNGVPVPELATISREKVVSRTLVGIPDREFVNVEFYSSALYFESEDGNSVVIQYFD
ncbi:hypothetical protein DFH11DRAFT_312721 [Phellopilus nigrolimitatus]|nr:hypothetical protein DFH11DRAFT_312721 [Phellopilus nigrolimitatus]